MSVVALKRSVVRDSKGVVQRFRIPAQRLIVLFAGCLCRSVRSSWFGQSVVGGERARRDLRFGTAVVTSFMSGAMVPIEGGGA